MEEYNMGMGKENLEVSLKDDLGNFFGGATFLRLEIKGRKAGARAGTWAKMHF